jgi:sugar phosphate isomerase/epimerase
LVSPRLSVSALSSIGNSFEEDLELWDELGIEHVGLYLDKLESAGLEPSVERVRAAGLTVSSIACRGFELAQPGTWDARRAALDAAVDVAAEVSAGCLFITAGAPGSLEFDDAVRALASAVDPVHERAAERGVAVAIENSNPMRRDVGFVHTLTDTVEVARRLELGVVVEVTNCWFERHLRAAIAAGVDTFRVVQISDYVVGDTTASERAVPGDGDIPLARLIAATVEAGFTGPFELEILGPRIEAEGYRHAIPRALAALAPMVPGEPVVPREVSGFHPT